MGYLWISVIIFGFVLEFLKNWFILKQLFIDALLIFKERKSWLLKLMSKNVLVAVLA